MPDDNVDIVPDLSKLSQLTESFAGFDSLIEKLNDSYRHLEERFESLNRQLEETNWKLRQALIENEKVQGFLNELLEAVPSGIVVYDAEGGITRLNRAAAQLLEIDDPATVRKDLGITFDSRPEVCARRTIVSQTAFLAEEKTLGLASGRQVIVALSTALLYDPERRVVGAVELYHDLTAMRELEKEISRVKTLAALGEIAATVAHEVRNPLGGILGFAALLRNDLGDDDPRAPMVDKIIKGVEHLDRSVSSLLEYAHDARPAVAEVQVRPFLEEVVQNFSMNVAQNGRNAVVDLLVSPEALAWRFDPQQIRQCLLNLMLNAHQAQTGDSEIRLSAVGDRSLTIVVTDEGCGIAPETRAKLFKPFFTTRPNGNGLGLATVKKLVLLHKGEVTVESEVGRGTSVTLVLPANLV